MRLRRKLEDLVGVEETDLLMDRPSGGWSDLVTRDDLGRELGALEARTTARFDGVDYRLDSLEARMTTGFENVQHSLAAFRFEMRAEIDRAFVAQTWRLYGGLVAFAGVMVAAVRL